MRPARPLLAAAALALVAAGCRAEPASGPDPTTAPTAPTTTSTAPPGPPGSCDEQAAGDLAVVCQAVALIERNYVDPVDSRALAAAAAEGILELTGGAPGPVSCDLTGAFAPICDSAEQVGGAPADMTEAALTGLVRFALDPYSGYLDREALALTEEEQSGKVEGIGALVRSEDLTAADPEAAPCPIVSDTCVLVVVSTIAGSPAERAGVLPGDRIVHVDGATVAGRDVDEVTALVRGPAGTEVTVGLDRAGGVVELTIVRAAIDVPVVEWEAVDPDTGYVRLNLFTENAGPQVRAALTTLLSGGATSIVLDLRDNPGGALNAAIDVASEFLADGLVLRTEAPDGETPYPVSAGGVATDAGLRLVVVVNRGSASAAEVVTGALQESGRAVVVGESTFGKNTVQQRFALGNGGALKLTIARWVTPGGTDFGGSGLAPDVAGAFPPEMTPSEVAEEALRLAEAA